MAAISCFLRLRHSSPSSKVRTFKPTKRLPLSLNQSWIGEKLKLSTNRPVSIFHYLRFKDQASSLRIVSKIITLSTLSVLKCFKF
ncbi:uncharacterized protein [Gossypium hirsutum]|uniref:Uncharacterized protein isoform X6 n=1 Tax=Gossypium hirsutum TaxID=3635 RepID=A0ABM3BCU1_GOSHI|nr:uncharacterized protein LOC107920551 isoform X6 [Gossypium hirsutum]